MSKSVGTSRMMRLYNLEEIKIYNDVYLIIKYESILGNFKYYVDHRFRPRQNIHSITVFERTTACQKYKSSKEKKKKKKCMYDMTVTPLCLL